MKGLFQVTYGSITGRNHALIGKNNQDAYYITSDENITIALVSDGCSSGEHSEVGAKLGVRIVADVIISNLKQNSGRFKSTFAQQLQQETLFRLKKIANHFTRNLDYYSIVHDCFLFTLVGAIITPVETLIFSVGDGVFAINGQVKLINSRVGENAPPYIAYGLYGHPEWGEIEIHTHTVTEKIQSILIGTDGVKDLIAVEDYFIPGKAEKVGNINQFWQEDRYFHNPDLIRRKLSLINREYYKPDWQNQQFKKYSGMLPDDTTLIVIRQNYPVDK